eukprot:2168080-Pyramimonas_sp.AAC.1
MPSILRQCPGTTRYRKERLREPTSWRATDMVNYEELEETEAYVIRKGPIQDGRAVPGTACLRGCG